MNPKYLYTLRWTQPYATNYQRPYIRYQQLAVEQAIEAQLARGEWPQAQAVIDRIRSL